MNDRCGGRAKTSAGGVTIAHSGPSTGSCGKPPGDLYLERGRQPRTAARIGPLDRPLHLALAPAP
ncbi:hypothetical protein ACFPRL_04050 [Pseudoclavibacter helvolus]